MSSRQLLSGKNDERDEAPNLETSLPNTNESSVFYWVAVKELESRYHMGIYIYIKSKYVIGFPKY